MYNIKNKFVIQVQFNESDRTYSTKKNPIIVFILEALTCTNYYIWIRKKKRIWLLNRIR